MRSDPTLKGDPSMAMLGRSDPREMDLTVQFSGGERDYVFSNRGGTSFDDVSLVSGLDDPADARSMALFDLDRDGWVDVALANANSPQLRFYRNRQGDGGTGAPPPSIALRLVGGRRDASPSAPAERWSARDGYGAQVRVDLGDGVLLREHRCGEGMASQNSATMLVGLGEGASAKGVAVKWPSGRTSEVGPVDAGSLVTVYENPADNGGRPARIEPYRPTAALAWNVNGSGRPRTGGPTLVAPALPALAEDGLVVYTSMATWCAVCKGELPQIARLRESFGTDEVELVAVPVDATDDDAKLAGYVTANAPRYHLRTDLGRDPAFRAGFSGIVQMATGLDGLPSSVVTDRNGRVLHAGTGVPSVSDLRRLRRNSF